MIGISNLKGLLHIGAALFICLMMSAAVSAETPPLRAIRFEGEFPFSTSLAQSIVEPRLDEPFKIEDAQDAVKRLRDACIRRYYPLAKVDGRLLPTKNKTDPVTLVFKVDPGPQGKLMEVRFSGQRVFSANELQKILTVRPRFGIWDRWLSLDVIKTDDLVVDQQALLSRYLQAGYATAKIGEARLEWIKALGGFRLTWPIVNEGPVYSVGYIRLDAEAMPAPASLAKILGLKAGERFEQNKVDAAVERFNDYYRNQGHAFVSVVAKEEWNEGKARVDLLFIARPGMKPRLRNVRISGNKVTKEHIVRREIPLKTGDRFDASALRDAQSALDQLPLFSDVKMDYDGSPDSPEYDLSVNVRERKTGRVEAGVLYGETEGAAFQFNVREDNLAFQPPFRGEALQGDLSVTAGSEILRLATGLRNPRVRDTYWTLDEKIYAEDNKYISDYYDQRSYGGHIFGSHPLGRHNVLTTGYAVDKYDVYNIDETVVDTTITETSQDTFLTSWVLAWSMDYTDRVLRPTRGLRLNASAGLGSRALGGDTDMLKTSAEAGLYLNPFRKHVVSLRAGLESVDPYGGTDTIAVPLRSFLGGNRDLRGFKYNSVSPLNDKGTPIGGQSAWWSSLEYLFPAHQRFDLALYYDVGDVGVDAYQFSGDGPVSDWGIGVLIRADNFPVRFDFATPLKTYEGDRNNEAGKTHFSFSAGYRF